MLVLSQKFGFPQAASELGFVRRRAFSVLTPLTFWPLETRTPSTSYQVSLGSETWLLQRYFFQCLPSVGQTLPVPSHSVQSPNMYGTFPSPLQTSHSRKGP